MTISYTLIAVHDNRIDLKPPCPHLLAGLQPFKIGVNWDHNNGQWKKVTIQNFQDAEGHLVKVDPASASWEFDATVYKDFIFLPTSIDYYCKYEVVLEDYNGKTFTIDPVVLIKKPGFAVAP